MTPTLIDLPPEISLAIAGYLDSSTDYVHLSRSHTSIGRTLYDSKVLAKTIKRIAGFSKECACFTSKEISPLDALLGIYNRQQAWSEGRPRSAIVLGDGQSFLYRQGHLAYVQDDLIRVLDVHSACRTEGVIYTSRIGPQLLDLDYKDSEVEMLHLHDALLTIIYRGQNHTAGWTSWVLVIDISRCERALLAVNLWTSEDLVVRNDHQYVCMVAPTGSSPNGGHREWVCRVWDTKNLPPRPSMLQIPDLSINELGQALIFEAFDGFLYAISTQPVREMEEPEWISHYTCFRFPLSNPDKSTLESIKIWRRHHQEGPINDLWTDLQLVRDESTGELSIIEARKEWTEGSSTQKRTWYRQRLPAMFSSPIDKDDKDQDMVDSNDQDDTTPSLSQSENLNDLSIMTDPPYLFTVPPGENSPTTDRLPCDTHAECSSTAASPSRVPNPSLSKTKFRTYINSASTFVDLIVDNRQDSSPTAWAQQLYLRIGSRKEASPLDEKGSLHPRKFYPHSTQAIEGSELRYESRGIHLWPPADAPAVLQDLLSGRTGLRGSSNSNESRSYLLGDVTAVADERSMVYLVKRKGAGETDKGRLILVNFDQYIQFWHDTWVPELLKLKGYGQDSQSAALNPAAHISINQIRESTEMDIDKPEEDSRSSQDHTDDWSENQEEKSLQPADELNDQFWCEEFDEDEPVSLDWLQEEMALWTDVKEGFCFV
ncbi:MAG: hypothetical protein Q9168_001780 [Polycauliona sp. 1 TL-2023]